MCLLKRKWSPNEGLNMTQDESQATQLHNIFVPVIHMTYWFKIIHYKTLNMHWERSQKCSLPLLGVPLFTHYSVWLKTVWFFIYFWILHNAGQATLTSEGLSSSSSGALGLLVEMYYVPTAFANLDYKAGQPIKKATPYGIQIFVLL